MISGIVEGINLSDENDAVNTIWVAVNKRGRQLIKASPLNMNHRIIPILGEMVYLVKASDETSTGVSNSEKYYYVSPVGVQRNINHNALPPYTELTGGGGGGFGFAEGGQVKARADGGGVGRGSAYMVGERGRELFIPNTDGEIVSNERLQQLGTNVNFTINATDVKGVKELLIDNRAVIVNIINSALNQKGKAALV